MLNTSSIACEMDRFVVIGGGGHAKVLIAVLKKSSANIVGYTDAQDRGAILGVSWLGDDTVLPAILRTEGSCQAIVGVGKIDTSSARLRLQATAKELGFEFPVIVSPDAVVNEEVELGLGTAVFDGAVVNSGATIGAACILNTNSTVEHDCRLGDNVHVGPGSILSGAVVVGSNCLIGTGANIIQGVTICHDCLVGAGATVITDIEVPGVYVGIPAKRLE